MRMSPNPRAMSRARRFSRLAVAVTMTIGGAGIAATLGIDATAGAATTAAAHAKVVAPQRTSGRAAQQQSVPSVLKGHIGRACHRADENQEHHRTTGYPGHSNSRCLDHFDSCFNRSTASRAVGLLGSV